MLPNSSYQQIKTELGYVALIGGVVLLLSFSFLGMEWNWPHAFHWVLIASFIWLLVLWQTWQRLALNRPDLESPPYPTLGYANHLTLLRGGLIALTGGFLFLPEAKDFLAWVPSLLYGSAAVLDRIDGFVARKTKRTSLLGSELDTLFDALGLVVAPLLAVCYGKAHWSFLSVSLAYYLFQWGLYWRRSRGFIVYPLLPSKLRRTLAGFQMGFVALLLLPCFHAPLTKFLAAGFMLPLLTGFILDWLIVSGRINGQSSVTHSFFTKLADFSASLFQPALRIILMVFLIHGTFNYTHFLYAPPTFPLASLFFFAALVLIGCAARVGALGILIIMSILIGQETTDWLSVFILLCAMGILLLGSGRFSLWQGDDAWVNRHDGA